MARGWESKSVEEQMATVSQQAEMNPGVGSGSEEQRRIADERTRNARRKQDLHLQRESILSQRTSSPIRRAALEAALKQVEAEIASLA
jgi:hypothetical protein